MPRRKINWEKAKRIRKEQVIREKENGSLFIDVRSLGGLCNPHYEYNCKKCSNARIELRIKQARFHPHMPEEIESNQEDCTLCCQPKWYQIHSPYLYFAMKAAKIEKKAFLKDLEGKVNFGTRGGNQRF